MSVVIAAEYPGLLVHTHLLELEEHNRMARSNGAEDSLDLLDSAGPLGDRLAAAHFRPADEDIRRTADADASVAHCPPIFRYWNTGGDVQWTPVRLVAREGELTAAVRLAVGGTGARSRRHPSYY